MITPAQTTQPSSLRFRYVHFFKHRAVCICSLPMLACSLIALTGAADRGVPPVEIGLTMIAPSTFTYGIERRGVVEALESEAVHSACYWSTNILSIVPEGTWVQQGDVVCTLDASSVEDYARTREVLLIKYRGRLDAALHDQKMLTTDNERRLEAARFRLQTAEQTLHEYESGSFPQDVEELEQQLSMLAEQEESAVDEFQHTEKMWAMGLVSRREMEAGAFELMKAREIRRKTESEHNLLTQFTNPRSVLNLSHGRDHAERSLARTQLTNGLAATKARLTTLSYERTIRIYERYYRRAIDSIEACTLRAPCSGQVLYGNSWYLKSRGITQIEEGKKVRNLQKIFEIPDPNRLKVSVAIDEALIRDVYEGMPVDIHLAGHEDVAIDGRIFEISKYPRRRSSYSPSVKDYWLSVEVQPTAEQKQLLKPKADAVVKMTLEEQQNVLQIPRTAVTGLAGHNFVFVYDGHEMVSRKVELGSANAETVCVLSGLHGGEQLVTQMTEQHEQRLQDQLQDELIASQQ